MRTPEEQRDAWARLGRWYADVRNARGFTQAEVAAMIGLSESRIRQIERARVAKSVPDDTRRLLEAALGVPAGTSEAVLADLPPGVDLTALPPITLTDDAGGQRVVYAGKVDPELLKAAARELAGKYLPTAS